LRSRKEAPDKAASYLFGFRTYPVLQKRKKGDKKGEWTTGGRKE